MRVMGVDPGLTRCGVGVVDVTVGRQPVLVEYGVIRTSAELPVGDRLLQIDTELAGWLARTTPDEVAVERVFSQHNVRTVMGTSQAAAVALLLAAKGGLPAGWHTPSEVKASVTGSGNAPKAQVGAMVARLLRLAAPPTPADAADALALALCHGWRVPTQRRHAAAGAGGRQ